MLDWVQDVSLHYSYSSYITVLKIQTTTCKDGRQVKIAIFVKADILRPLFLRDFVVYSDLQNKNKDSMIRNSERMV